MRKKESERKRRRHKEMRSDEESLYYILERDLDREAVFQEHDGWYSQVSLGKRKRIDYILRYNDKIYGIEVKTGYPKLQHFNQAEKYCVALNGIFLAYPSDRVGEALFLCESKQRYLDIGLLSLTLFRSHIIRKAKQYDRQNEQIWNDYNFDEKKYWDKVKTWSWQRADGLPATILRDECFWISYNPHGSYSEENFYRLPLSKSDWQALGVLYAITTATSLDRYFSWEYLWKLCQQIGWKSFYPWNLVQCNLADLRSYGDRLSLFSLTPKAHFLQSSIRKVLKQKLVKQEWKKIDEKIAVWKQQHKENQSKYEKEFAIL